MKTILTLSLAALTLSSAYASQKGVDVIYGIDNRKDVFESTDSALVELSKSTAAMIDLGNLKSLSSGDIQISAGTLESRGICSTERFSQQISAANCSGFLVAPDVIVTAGHCIQSAADCSGSKWVFDYKVENADQKAINVPKTSVYACSKIISQAYDRRTKNDFAVIQLDRKVTDRRPLAFRKTGKVTKGTALALIGNPSGLPTKIADGAVVRSTPGIYFVANTDSFAGNSGSAVFNTKTGEVEGILVRGETDYVLDSERGCNVPKVCASDACRGEDVTYITNLDVLKNL